VQTPEYDPSLLKTYLKELGVPYFYESHGIIEQAACSLQALDARQLLVYAASSYECMRPYASSVCGLKLLVYEALAACLLQALEARP
jgi:hypothetical protein